MKLSEIKEYLNSLASVDFQLPDGTFVPAHFHVTEIGTVDKRFIDCGGTVRMEKAVNFQLWNANDTEHRLKPGKLLKIIALSEDILGIEDGEIEVEYQSGTIGKYGLEYNGSHFLLTPKHTDCLAKENCGIPEGKKKLQLSDLQIHSSCCAPGTNCG